MSKWFTSDLHFGHRNVIKLCNRPYSDLQEMNEHIIQEWNKVIKPRSEVFVLGDFSFLGISATKSILNRLNGDIRIVKGNHDKYAKALIDMGFTNVYENHQIELVKGVKVNLSHFPYYTNSQVRYSHKRIVNEGIPLLHGHTHSNERINTKNGIEVHVGWDAWFRLVSADECYELIKGVGYV